MPKKHLGCSCVYLPCQDSDALLCQVSCVRLAAPEGREPSANWPKQDGIQLAWFSLGLTLAWSSIILVNLSSLECGHDAVHCLKS